MNKNLSFKHYLLTEMPLPTDWDKNKFNNNTPFAQQIRYAKERAQQIGVGSSRVAFIVPYQGRQTVLKIAKNKKGLAQNEHEVGKLNDYYLNSLNITIPIIDYDEESNLPTWIHTEYASKAKNSDFIKACGGTLADLCAYAVEYHGGNDWTGGNASKINGESDLADGFAEFIGNYDTPINDYNRLSNWGIYKNNPVIVDIGVDKDILKTYYS